MNSPLSSFSFCALGYCGADIKALCTEAALIALRRRYPQIYASSHKLQLDVSSIVLNAQDFYHAMQNIVPASQRAVMSSGHALSPIIRPLLGRPASSLGCSHGKYRDVFLWGLSESSEKHLSLSHLGVGVRLLTFWDPPGRRGRGCPQYVGGPTIPVWLVLPS